MRAVILAAGSGGRLRGIVGDRPKGLAVVGGCTLIERQIRALRECGIARIAVVAGFGAPHIRRVCDSSIDIVDNVRFASTNSLYSLWLARDLLAEGFVVLNCDVLFHRQLLADLLTSGHDDALLMCPRSNGLTYSDEEMKVRVRHGLVTDIDKALPQVHADGENVGIAKFGAAGAVLLVDEMTAIVESGGLREWLPRAFAAFSSRRPLHAIETRGYPWIEIDFPEDYRLACNEVLPAIEADRPAARPTAAAASVPGEPCHV
jgi:choline kinase